MNWKNIGIILTATVLIISFCAAAGCLASDAPIVGTWSSSGNAYGEYYYTVIMFNSDGTGYDELLKDENVRSSYNFTWKKITKVGFNPDNMYSVVFSDNDTEVFTYDEKNDTLSNSFGWIYTRIK